MSAQHMPARKCGGDMYTFMSSVFSVPRGAGIAIKPGSVVPCPHCDKPVKLRVPFNAAQSIYVQVPRHNRAAIAKATGAAA